MFSLTASKTPSSLNQTTKCPQKLKFNFSFTHFIFYSSLWPIYFLKKANGAPFNSGKDTRDVVGRGWGQVALTTY